MTSFNYNNKEIVNKVFKQADRYFLFIDEMAYKVNNIEYLNPYYTNCLFCCELYIKAILLMLDKDKKILQDDRHHLKKLFNRIKDADELNGIKIKTFLTDKLNKRLDGISSIDSFFNSIDNDFTAVRYMYIEKNHIIEKVLNKNFAMCIMLMYVLRDFLDLIINGRDTYKELKNNVSI